LIEKKITNITIKPNIRLKCKNRMWTTMDTKITRKSSSNKGAKKHMERNLLLLNLN
jgi:hypothetical protein